MTVLFGHPTGNPNAHHAALAHFEAGWLEAWCVPWMPRAWELAFARRLPGLGAEAERLSRRRFPPLAHAPRIEGRWQEWFRMARRVLCATDERLSYEANDWLMETMRRACARPAVTAVHAYEDCALGSFEEAKPRGKACIYDMPIGYYRAWERLAAGLSSKHRDWLPPAGAMRAGRPEQKRREMAAADLVLVPSRFVAETIRSFHPERPVAVVPYGVDLEFWQPGTGSRSDETLRFICVGHLSVRKGTPLLLEAWDKAALRCARLDLVGAWQLAEGKRELPHGVAWTGPCSREALRERLRDADVFVLPSYFEGMALSVLEAMACGLPAIVTDVTGPEVVPADAGRVVETGNVDALVEALRWFENRRSNLREMKLAARRSAERYTWDRYRGRVAGAVAPFV